MGKGILLTLHVRRYPLDQPLIFPNLPQLPTVHSAPVRKSSVLRAASALGIVSDRPQPIVYTPKRAWVSQATTVRCEAAEQFVGASPFIRHHTEFPSVWQY